MEVGAGEEAEGFAIVEAPEAEVVVFVAAAEGDVGVGLDAGVVGDVGDGDEEDPDAELDVFVLAVGVGDATGFDPLDFEDVR